MLFGVGVSCRISYWHCVIYGVESWSEVLEWSHGVEFWSGFWSGTESDFEFCHLSWTGLTASDGVEWGQILEQSQTIFYDLPKYVNIHSAGVGVNSYHTG